MAENHYNFVAESQERNKKQENEKEEEKEEETQERVTESSLPTESRTSSPPGEARPNPETLVVPSPLPHDHASHLQRSSTANEGDKVESKERAGQPEEEIIVNDTVEAPQTQTENKLQVSGCSTPLSEPLPASVAQSLSSVPSPILPKQKLSPSKANGAEVDKRTPSSGTVSPVSDVRESASDGYNWRKYGQKQVKSPTGSRSYYRCSHSDCCAKKIKCCDQLGRMIEIVYKSQHNHDPPHKTNSTRKSKFLSSTRESKLPPSTKEIKLLPSNEPNVDNTVTNQSIKVLSDSDPSPSPKEPLQEAPCSADRKRQNSSNGENGKVILKEENVNEPEPKRRMKKGDLTCLDSPVKPGKKSKFVVHAVEDVGISDDGYRWRKYGQKMVKGNPRPRNYYRCTSAGCPVRKHIETAVDNSNALIITYKGVHDHDMPVPKKRHGLPSPPLVAAAAPASMNSSQVKRTDSMPNQKTSTQPSIDKEGELSREALELDGEKAMESARTLLSIGIEIKHC